MLWKTVISSKSQKQLIAQLYDTIFYLQNPQPTFLTNESTLDVVALIRPEIKIYIDKYGFPSGGVFDTYKLGEILNEVQIVKL
jgi:hypothetical protein